MLSVLALVGLVSATPPEVSLTITDVYTSKVIGGHRVPHTPAVGEDYELTVKYRASGAVSEFHVDMWLGGRKELKLVNATPNGERSATHNFGRLPLDGKIDFRVELDPFDWAGGADKTKRPKPLDLDQLGTGAPVAGGHLMRKQFEVKVYQRRIAGGWFKPTGPANRIEYFEPVILKGSQAGLYDFKSSGKTDRIALLMGQPASDSWQKLLSITPKVSATLFGGGGWVGEPTLLGVQQGQWWPIYYWDQKSLQVDKLKIEQKFRVQVSNQRVNEEKLSDITWSQVDALQGLDVFKFYVKPESVIESSDPRIRDFVNGTLGAGYRNRYTPYAAARKMFQAVLANVSYTFPFNPGDPDLRGHTAVETLVKRKGDCGSFSVLIVAAMRQMGIPARTACGFWVGGGAHCWAEIFLPFGWILCDGSGGNSWSESGEYAYCFGNQFDLNSRMAFMRGNTFKVNDIYADWLQGPHQAWWGSRQIDEWTHKHVVEIEKTTLRLRDLKTRRVCPCEAHGGIRLSQIYGLKRMGG